MIAAFLYSVILLMLLVMDIYLIQSEQEKRMEGEEAILSSYAEETERSLDQIDKFLYDLYRNDSNFLFLQREHGELEEYSAAYDISLLLQSRCQVEEALAACSLFYHNLSHSLYKLNDNAFPRTDMRPLNEAMKLKLSGDVQRERSVISIDGNVYLVIRYQKGGAAVCGVHSFYGIEQKLRELDGDSAVLLLSEGSVISGSAASEAEALAHELQGLYGTTYVKSGSRYRVYCRRITGTPLWIALGYKSTFLGGVTLRTILLIILTISSLIAAVVLYFYLRRQIIRPLRRTTQIMEQIRTEGISEIPEVESSFRELTDVRDTLASMLQALEQQKIRTYEAEAERQRVQLQYFAMQLKPHFYLNSLKTLDALVFESEPEKAHELILDLSDCLRYLLYSEQELVSLGQELEFTGKYVNMQKYISSRALSYSVSCDEGLYGWRVPRLAVQTFVENSVKYARKGNYRQELEISVEIYELETEQGKLLNISIRDNGVGFSQEYLDWFYSSDWNNQIGIGIGNLIRRCRIIYGWDERLESSIMNDHGAVAELVLPEIRGDSAVDS